MVELKDKIGETNFVWGEFLWLQHWRVHGFPKDSVKENIIKVANKLQLVRNFYNRKIIITSGWRPELYNELIKGSHNSRHMTGEAVDFYVDGMSCDQVRKDLQPKLEEWKIRMEDLPRSSWVHLDISPVIHQRFFKP